MSLTEIAVGAAGSVDLVLPLPAANNPVYLKTYENMTLGETLYLPITLMVNGSLPFPLSDSRVRSPAGYKIASQACIGFFSRDDVSVEGYEGGIWTRNELYDEVWLALLAGMAPAKVSDTSVAQRHAIAQNEP